VLLGRVLVALGLEHLERVDQALAGLARLDDGVHVAALGRDVGVGELVLELQDDLSTETTREGERFTAKIVGSNELNGALIEGRIEKIQMPGRLKRRAELQLTFDRVVLDQARWANFSGILIEVVPVVGDNVSRISNEGTAIGQSSVKDDAVKLGIATGAGAGIGAIAGGPVGAAIGAGVGAAYGIGSAVVDRGKHIRLNKNQQIRVRSSYDVVIR